MPVQTSYAANISAAAEGQKSGLGLTNIISATAEDSDIPFGRAVVQGTGDNQCKLPTAAGQIFLGITELTSAWSVNAAGDHLYSENREVNIIDFGEVWVYTEESVVPGDVVYFRHTAGASPIDVIGRFRKDSSTGDADLVAGAAFRTTTAAGGIAKIKMKVPGVGLTVPVDSADTVVATSGALLLTTETTYFDTTAGVSTATLADGVAGQIKYLKMLVDGGNMVLTPANLADGATLTFADVNDACTLRFDGTNWGLFSNVGVAIA